MCASIECISVYLSMYVKARMLMNSANAVVMRMISRHAWKIKKRKKPWAIKKEETMGGIVIPQTHVADGSD